MYKLKQIKEVLPSLTEDLITRAPQPVVKKKRINNWKRNNLE